MKTILKRVFNRLGYKVTRLNQAPVLNENPFKAVKAHILRKDPVFFDVGMNHGQTLKKIQNEFPSAVIHGFEPSRKCFAAISEKSWGEQITLNNKALGEKEGIEEFHEYSWDALNSLLKRAFTKAKLVATYPVNVTTLDRYCEENQIRHIDFLKTDTEGFELNVLKGGQKLFLENKIHFVHVELFFDENFIGQSSAAEIIGFLEAHKFTLVRFYEMSYSEKGHASRCDALFCNTSFSE